MSNEVLCALIAGVCGIVCAIVSAISVRTMKRSERHQKLRQEEALLSLKMMDATVQLSIVSANALTNGHNNGNVERARLAAEEAMKEYQNFIMRTTAYEVGK